MDSDTMSSLVSFLRSFGGKYSRGEFIVEARLVGGKAALFARPINPGERYEAATKALSSEAQLFIVTEPAPAGGGE